MYVWGIGITGPRATAEGPLQKRPRLTSHRLVGSVGGAGGEQPRRADIVDRDGHVEGRVPHRDPHAAELRHGDQHRLGVGGDGQAAAAALGPGSGDGPKGGTPGFGCSHWNEVQREDYLRARGLDPPTHLPPPSKSASNSEMLPVCSCSGHPGVQFTTQYWHQNRTSRWRQGSGYGYGYHTDSVPRPVMTRLQPNTARPSKALPIPIFCGLPAELYKPAIPECFGSLVLAFSRECPLLHSLHGIGLGQQAGVHLCGVARTSPKRETGKRPVALGTCSAAPPSS